MTSKGHASEIGVFGGGRAAQSCTLFCSLGGGGDGCFLEKGGLYFRESLFFPRIPGPY